MVTATAGEETVSSAYLDCWHSDSHLKALAVKGADHSDDLGCMLA